METLLISLIIKYANINNIDKNLALAVAQVESGMNSQVISSTDDYGLFQLNINSFPSFSKKQLLDPETNIRLGTAYLAKMKKECGKFKNNSWIVCYNVGSSKAKTFKYPYLHSYVKKVNKAYAKL